MLSEFAVSRALQPAHVCPEVLTSGCIWAGGEHFVHELMALLGATAQEIVNMARSAFGGTRAGAIPNAERAPQIWEFFVRMASLETGGC